MIPEGRTAPYQLRPAKQRSHRSINISRCRSSSRSKIKTMCEPAVPSLAADTPTCGMRVYRLQQDRPSVLDHSILLTSVGAMERLGMSGSCECIKCLLRGPIASRVQCWMAPCRRINNVMRWTGGKEAVVLGDGSSRGKQWRSWYVAFEPVLLCLQVSNVST